MFIAMIELQLKQIMNGYILFVDQRNDISFSLILVHLSPSLFFFSFLWLYIFKFTNTPNLLPKVSTLILYATYVETFQCV